MTFKVGQGGNAVVGGEIIWHTGDYIGEELYANLIMRIAPDCMVNSRLFEPQMRKISQDSLSHKLLYVSEIQEWAIDNSLSSDPRKWDEDQIVQFKLRFL